MLPLPGDLEAFCSFVSHDDAATAVAAALGLPSGTYNATDDDPVTRRVLGDTLATLLGVKPPRPLPKWVSRLLGSLGELLSRSQTDLQPQASRVECMAATLSQYP
jgi:nucleoside-diphosphate-sugar epimerase